MWEKRNAPLTAPSHLVADIFIVFVPVVGILGGFNDHSYKGFEVLLPLKFSSISTVQS